MKQKKNAKPIVCTCCITTRPCLVFSFQQHSDRPTERGLITTSDTPLDGLNFPLSSNSRSGPSQDSAELYMLSISIRTMPSVIGILTWLFVAEAGAQDILVLATPVFRIARIRVSTSTRRSMIARMSRTSSSVSVGATSSRRSRRVGDAMSLA